ncbi:MAG TPA: GldG family protein [Candidatus Atribacteria bacterium]|nr:GldG family protein [Candidatus Atribacteria bacterium]HPT78421.1 GldG family protein [Candidatus Atribacteria bacterium]
MKKPTKTNILRSFNTRKFKYGGYATLLTAIVLAVLLVINLVVDLIPMRLDLTKNKVYSLSQETFKVLDKLEENITIYTVNPVNQGIPLLDEILYRYQSYSNKIRIDYIDPNRDPIKAQRFTKDDRTLSNGDVIVAAGSEGNERFRHIKSYELVNYSSDYSSVESLAIEQRVTSAIMYVSGAEAPVVYVLEGHGETSINYNVRSQMELENYSIKSLNLLTEKKVPEDAGILIINSPSTDLTEDEEKAIREYLENEGRAIFIMDFMKDEKLDNFNALLRSYGVATQKRVIIEGDQTKYYPDPFSILPSFESHKITSSLSSNRVPLIMPVAQGIEILDTRRNTLKIEPLMKTSKDSYARTADSKAETIEKSEGDVDGPFNLAVAITDSIFDQVSLETKVTKLVVIGTSRYLDTPYQGRINLTINSLNWLVDREQSITIRPKSVYEIPLKVTANTFKIYGFISVILIPIGALGAGVAVWLRRRHL